MKADLGVNSSIVPQKSKLHSTSGTDGGRAKARQKVIHN